MTPCFVLLKKELAHTVCVETTQHHLYFFSFTACLGLLQLLQMRINKGQTDADGGQQGDGVTGSETLGYPFRIEATLEGL